ncbi:hypothetical protein J6590_054572 [Homalodisca vitripennis]|nr:hypothetical protein J6590_054572 [Homalodisca vitripennis]
MYRTIPTLPPPLPPTDILGRSSLNYCHQSGAGSTLEDNAEDGNDRPEDLGSCLPECVGVILMMNNIIQSDRDMMDMVAPRALRGRRYFNKGLQLLDWAWSGSEKLGQEVPPHTPPPPPLWTQMVSPSSCSDRGIQHLTPLAGVCLSGWELGRAVNPIRQRSTGCTGENVVHTVQRMITGGTLSVSATNSGSRIAEDWKLEAHEGCLALSPFPRCALRLRCAAPLLPAHHLLFTQEQCVNVAANPDPVWRDMITSLHTSGRTTLPAHLTEAVG